MAQPPPARRRHAPPGDGRGALLGPSGARVLAALPDGLRAPAWAPIRRTGYRRTERSAAGRSARSPTRLPGRSTSDPTGEADTPHAAGAVRPPAAAARALGSHDRSPHALLRRPGDRGRASAGRSAGGAQHFQLPHVSLIEEEI